MLYHEKISCSIRCTKSKGYGMKVSRVGFENVLTAVYTDKKNLTGATCLIFPEGATGSAIVLGGGATTRGFDSLRPEGAPTKIYALGVVGGSAAGIDALQGVTRYLREEDIGLEIDNVKVPTLAGAVIFDLFVGNPVAPSAEGIYRSCIEAKKEVPLGRYGAGTGATVGKLFTVKYASSGGQGYVEEDLGACRVGCLCVVNAFGDVKRNDVIVAGTKDPNTGDFANTALKMRHGILRKVKNITSDNTTVCVVLTDAALSKAEAYRVAVMAASGMARAIDPVWTVYDGDVVVVLSIGSKRIHYLQIGAVASKLVEECIVLAVSP